MPARREKFRQALDDFGLGAVHALIERLDGEICAVAVDYQAGQLIAFAMHQAVGIGVRHDAAAVLFGLRDPPPEKILVDGLDAVR